MCFIRRTFFSSSFRCHSIRVFVVVVSFGSQFIFVIWLCTAYFSTQHHNLCGIWNEQNKKEKKKMRTCNFLEAQENSFFPFFYNLLDIVFTYWVVYYVCCSIFTSEENYYDFIFHFSVLISKIGEFSPNEIFSKFLPFLKMSIMHSMLFL